MKNDQFGIISDGSVKKKQVESEGGQFLITDGKTKGAVDLPALTSDSDNKENIENKYYSLELQEMELMPERSTKGEGSLNPDNSTNSISAIKLLQGVEKSNSHPPCLLRRASCYGFFNLY